MYCWELGLAVLEFGSAQAHTGKNPFLHTAPRLLQFSKTAEHHHTVRKFLADFAVCDWRRFCKALCDVKFSQIEGNYRIFIL